MPPCSRGSETLPPTNPPIDLDFGDDHRGLDPFRLQRRRSGGGRADQDMHPAPQIADRALADPAAIDIEDELGAALHQDGAGVDGAQADDQRKAPVLDEVVDHPALQLERHDFEQKHGDGQHHQGQLVPTARFQNIAVYVAGDFGRNARARPPCDLASRRGPNRMACAVNGRRRSPPATAPRRRSWARRRHWRCADRPRPSRSRRPARG